MIEFVLVDHPVAFPQSCIGCLSQQGPMMDTHRQVQGFGHVYVCHRCLKIGARLSGYAKGERLDRLENSLARETEHEREIVSLVEQLQVAKTEVADWSRLSAEQAETLRDRDAHITYLETEIRRAAELTLAAVGG